ncbi:MAG: hypothetical protein QW409_02260 [Candidatus Aenigmatarchaeota archaeon]
MNEIYLKNDHNEHSHIYFSSSPQKHLFAEYIYNLLQQRGGFNNINKELRDYIYNKIGKPEKKNKRIKEEFKEKITLGDLNYLLKKFIEIKLKSKKKKFDSFILPSFISRDQFKNMSPIEIIHENNLLVYNLLENIFRYGFPLTAGNSLYIFYIDPELIEKNVLYEIHQGFYQNLEKLSYSLQVYFNLVDNRKTEVIREIYMLEDRDYFNSLLFIISLKDILNNIDKNLIKNIENSEIIVWKKSEMRGSVFILSNLKFVLDLIGDSLRSSELVKLLGYTFLIRSFLENPDKMDNLLDNFSYYLLVKNILDYKFIEELIKYTIDYYKEKYNIKFLNKYFIINFMEKVSNYNLYIFFDLGQKLRKNIFGMISDQFKKSNKNSDQNKQKLYEEVDKYIDRIAKDLRNEELPEYFIETFEKDIVWLKSRGMNISSELSDLFRKLVEEINKSDLPRFYLIKAAIILGLLSPSSKNEEVTENNET